ncbi:hypothetical protein QYE76_006705 [Lolium multiflorum]|uniref:Uncharacterized protein n=1 Tax=Lolium multiflorum TaxID=4521 RepID=A0AAD8RVB0_LOLMU|nr:hypothetical protein QYE76_006705 [Lolium multiflorum]
MADEAALLLGVPREVEFIRSELQMMQSFLRVQSSAACSDGGCYKDTVRTCVKQVRDLACDLEDCLLDFTMTMHASRGSWLQCRGPDLAARHRVADRIRLLKASLEELNQRNQRYNVFAADASVVAVERSQRFNVFAAAADGRVELNQGNPRYVIVADHGPTAVEEHRHGNADEEYQLAAGEEHQDIKRDDETKQLADLVREQSASVVSVWGMGGMGKSSLVRMLYNDRDLIDGFDGRAWITVSHPLDCTDEMERRLKKQLGVDPSHGLRAWLGKKRCLVVVDDVSSQEEWELISSCLGGKGAGSSRLVVTTRREDVALLCAGEKYKYKLKPLKLDEARKLLRQKVYKNDGHEMTNDMSDQADLILRRCRGLPLAIDTIGGLLASRPKTSREWMNLRKHIGSELESDRDIKRVITSSYDGLPYHLKSCFLYLSIFPENHEIRFTRLLRRWMAEGYITKPRDMSIEEVGWRYYNELVKIVATMV